MKEITYYEFLSVDAGYETTENVSDIIKVSQCSNLR